MKRISIGTWAYSIGPYADNPVPFDEILRKLADAAEKYGCQAVKVTSAQRIALIGVK